MTMNWNEQIMKLNDLYELLADGRLGYEKAAQNVEHPEIADFLRLLCRQRESMQDALAAEIQRFRPDDRLKDGTAKGVLHRAWMDIREALGKSDDTNMLDECERGEKYLIERYDAVVSDPGIAGSSKQLLTAQRELVQENLTTVKNLRLRLEEVGK